MEIIIEQTRETPVGKSSVEIVERKGIGHPDTLCDGVAEELSKAFSKYYLKHFGRILHHNVDKCLLVGGCSEVSFGGGRVTVPMKLIIAGRATEYAGNSKIPLEEIAKETIYAWLRNCMRFLEPEKNVVIDMQTRTGSADLRATYDSTQLSANDTSVGVGFSPMTELESIVYSTEQFLNSAETKRNYPMVGEDIKIMGIRLNDQINLTIAIAFVARFISSKEEYLKIKRLLAEYIDAFIKKRTSKRIASVINAADDAERDIYYLTVTGTSAECGDDGQVGRGNRVNGLITPYRPMTMEATAGKNPVTHTGKLYNIAAHEISRELTRNPDIHNAECYLVSQIGKPITEPQIVHIKIHSSLTNESLEDICTNIARKHLHLIPQLWENILEQRFTLF
ncbi:methionine adenosyltransferase [Candidatus Kuenenia sp.]|uniref:methionine adenosyltransferase n=1 Tax=Candidatus Kuenenia sp. TaxID=2499824 RepID=UPI00322044B5